VKIILGIPHSGQVVWSMAQAVWRSSQEHEVEVLNLPSSLLACSFNVLYAEALNRNEFDGFDGLFAMLHADVAPPDFWLDPVAGELLKRKADLVSVVNAIKDERGLTSSGVALPCEPWKPWRRFTMKELAEFPETFNAADAGYDDMVLLHNTGCWVADIRNPLFHEEDENGCLKAFFTINDRIKRDKDGRWRPGVEPEDWFFSRRMHDLRANTYVTRKVVTHHWGMADADNQTVRGQDVDTELITLWGDHLEEVTHACN
jgi:hypothetical protein